MNRKPIALTGIKPTGTPHIGNYLGSIKPALELVGEYDAIYFIADYHALTIMRDREQMQQHCYEVAATWLALGLDPEEVIFYCQSSVPEVFEMTWILECFTAKGLLNRAHAYKAASQVNVEAQRNPDDGVNAGLYNYPVLMAADILLFNTDVVPVGLDQKQHIEVARDVAMAFNSLYGDVLKLPEARIRAEVAVIPGLDGRKMSKSYGNTIRVFDPPEVVRKQIMRIVTDSSRPEDPKNPDQCNVFNIYKHFSTPEEIDATRECYLAGGVAYGQMKHELLERIDATFCDARERYNLLIEDRPYLDKILQQGAEKAQAIAKPQMQAIRQHLGIIAEVA